ncbi:NUDIX hydrolase [Puniceicoccaceae bacterium K14]|nr:NUDIX hydrolase [Puniceicoccaceae bacterium K14]
MELAEHQSNLIADLERYSRKYPQESDTVELFIDFVKRNVDCFSRDLQEGHITGSAWIQDETGAFALLTHHGKLDRWFQVGGHCEGETKAQDASFREATEESGLTDLKFVSEEIFDIDRHLFPEKNGFPAHYHYDVRFLLKTSDKSKIAISEESQDLQWFISSAIANVTDEESVLRMVRKTKL